MYFPNWRKFCFIILVMAAAGGLLWYNDDGMSAGWPTNVLRNWLQYGLGPMHGALVTNDGGFDAVAHPNVYPGMSPWYLYPVYFSTQALDWTGLGTLSYHLLLAGFVFWGIWSLLGKTPLALTVAALCVLSPGYGRWQRLLDPNVLAVLVGFPYAALINHQLQKSRQGLQSWLLVAVATVAFVPANWTTAWFLAPFGIYLLCRPGQQPLRPRLIYLSLTAVGSLLFVYFSVVARQTTSIPLTPTPPASGSFIGGYTWGTNGYYEGLSTVRFLQRVVIVSLIGLLPVWCVWGWRTARIGWKQPATAGISLLPFLMAAAQIAVMRNYFCHHPWMAAPVVLTGLVFSLALLPNNATPVEADATQIKGPAVAAAIAAVYGFIIIAGLRANNEDTLAMLHLVRPNTARTDWIVIVQTQDSTLAMQANRLSAELDRHVVAVADWHEIPTNQSFVILATVPRTDGVLLAQNNNSAGPGGWNRAVNWFRHNVSRRQSGDAIELPGSHYLYRPAR